MKTVLVVDDEAGLRESLSLALRDEFEVSTASSAEEALELIERSRPEAMVLDQGMPGISGLGLLARLNGQDAPGTIMLSGKMDLDLARRALHLGAEDLMGKPFDVAELKKMLHQATDHAHRARPEEEPLALRGARVMDQAALQTAPLPVRSRWFSRTMVAEALSECRGDRAMAARRLGMNAAELENFSEQLLEY